MLEPEPTSTTPLKPSRSLIRRLFPWFLGAVVLVVICAFIASFFLDRIIRPRVEANMNSSLKGYRATLPHAHLQLLGFTLTLRDLTIVQLAHPQPAVAVFPLMRFRIHWQALLFGRVVANVRLWRPVFHINPSQLATERKDPTPLRDEGWQDALQNAYPFKINRFVIDDGDVVYVDGAESKPLHLTHLNVVSDNIRNIQEPNHPYPSWFRASLVIFDRGKISLDGRANYLMKPFPGTQTRYTIADVPMDAVTTASRHINVLISGGTFASDGFVEYSPKVTNVDVHHVTFDAINLTYSHRPATEDAEARRITTAGRTVEKETNRRAVNIKVRELDIKRSRLAFDDETSKPPFNLYLIDTDLKLLHLANHRSEGPARLMLNGKFMGSGITEVTGTFLAAGAGPEFNVNIAIVNTDLTSLNPLLRAYGRFDVARGRFTVYSQLGVRNANMSGYVKPMFSDLKVYDYQQDKNKGILSQAKEMMIGAASHIFKNPETQRVATQVNVVGPLKKPNVSTWEAFVEIVRNAFVQAILPGFDRELHIQSAANSGR
jgi:Domain of Unknown Function (DUF748)